jgi:hypothetical protein
MAKFIPNENCYVAFSLGPVGSVAPPTAGTATAAASEGTLAAGTFDYELTSVNASGESVASSAITAASH